MALVHKAAMAAEAVDPVSAMSTPPGGEMDVETDQQPRVERAEAVADRGQTPAPLRVVVKVRALLFLYTLM